MKDFEILKNLGLTNTESKVYLELLELGETLAGKIASNIQIHRKNAYDALASLLQKGLVVYTIKKGRKYWKPISPEKIISILKEKESQLNVILPILLSKFKETKIEQSVEVFEGKEGMKSFYDFVLRIGKDYSIFGASGELFDKLEFYVQNFIDTALKKHMHAKLLFEYNAKNINKITKIDNVEFRILPQSVKSPTQIMLFDVYSAIIIWSEVPIVVLIKSKEISKGFDEYFNLLWKQAGK